MPDLFSRLIEAGYQVEFHSHARAILQGDFPAVAPELELALLTSTIPIEEIIAGGGGEAKGTQRLRKTLANLGWSKVKFKVERRINDVPRESQTHEIDHVKTFDGAGTVALEIEWNNKDPFFDRDLENFKRLHSDSAISVGVIVTRGQSLQDEMQAMVTRFVEERQIRDLEGLREWGYEPTSKQKGSILGRMQRKKNPLTFRDAFVSKFVADKFGKATTHWNKLQERVARGVGNPCPLVLIGLPSSIVRFGEGKAALAEVQQSEEEAEAAEEAEAEVSET